MDKAMIFETHAHYDDEAFDQDRRELLQQIEKSGIAPVVNIGADIASCKTTLELCREYSFIYGALGVHPSGVKELDGEEALFTWLQHTCAENSLKKGGRIVAVGEIGLDYYWPEPEAGLQKKWFERQLVMAKEVKLPVVIHSRDAARDTLDMMKALHAGEAGGIIHCYSYTKELAKDFLSMGFAFGIGGVITFKNARKLKETVEYLPLENIVLETDSPYLAPEPNRGKRNSSLNLTDIAAEIGRIKGIGTEEVIEVTAENAKRIFGM